MLAICAEAVVEAVVEAGPTTSAVDSPVAMPVKTRAKAAARTRLQRLQTQFGELETTPTSHHHRADAFPAMQSAVTTPRGNGPQPWAEPESYQDGFDASTLAGLDDLQSALSENRPCSGFQWSETESQARRSSPLHPGETPMAPWQFDPDESLPLLSTPASGRDKLPDTVPLPGAPQAPGEQARAVPASVTKIDFSETASTTRRSSPVGLRDSFSDFFDSDLDNVPGPTPVTVKESTRHANDTHLPVDNIYEATPAPEGFHSHRESGPGAKHGCPPVADVSVSALASHAGGGNPNRREKPIARDVSDDSPALLVSPTTHQARHRKPRKQELQSQRADAQSKPRMNLDASEAAQTPGTLTRDDKRKKSKQRPKPPLQFDDVSLQLMNPQSRPKPGASTRSRGKAPQKPRMPIVSALRDSAQQPSHQVTLSRKRGAESLPSPKKKAKTATEKELQRAPLGDASRQHHPGTKPSPPVTQLNKPAVGKPPKAKSLRANPPKAKSPKAKSPKAQPPKAKSPKAQPPKARPPKARPPKAQPPPRPELPSPVDHAEAIFVSSDIDRRSDSFSSSSILRGAPDGVIVSSVSPSHSEADEGEMLVAPSSKGAFVSACQAKEDEILGHTRKPEVVERREDLAAPGSRDPDVDTDANLRERGLYHAATNASSKEAVDQDVQRPGGFQPQPSRAVTRSFSVSALGSPLPAHPRAAQRCTTVFEGLGMSNLKQLGASGEPSRSEIVQGARRDEPVQAPSGQAPNGSQNQWRARKETAGSETRRARFQDSAKVPAEISGHVHAQIVASLQDRGTRSGETTGSATQEGKDKDLGTDAGSRAPDVLSQQLHQLVEVLVKQLRSKEKAGLKVAEVYRARTASCIEKIGTRQKQERKAMLATVTADATKFRHMVERAGSTVMSDSRQREPQIRELEHSVSERLALYERATASLRALHRQLLDGGGVSR